MKQIDRVVQDAETGRMWTIGFLSWGRSTAVGGYFPELRGRMRLSCTPASGTRVFIELPSADARDDDAVLHEIRNRSRVESGVSAGK
jgi:hypothetical protein